MKRIAILLALFGACFLCAAPQSVFAQATRTWISGVGDDANPCSRTAPCKTFAGAIAKTSTGGEINCLDPGGFGALTITKAITIYCDEASNGGVLVSGTNGFVVSAGPNDVVVISGIDFEGLNSGLDGIKFNTGAALYVRNCIIRNFIQNGIEVANSGNSSLFVNNTAIINSGSTQASGTWAGIQIKPTSSANVAITINDTQISNSYFGIVVDGSSTTGTIRGTIRNSAISSSAHNGVTASIGTASNITIMLDNDSVANNLYGLVASGANAGMIVGNTTITGNTNTGVLPAFGGGGGPIYSYNNNRVNGNGNDGAFTSTINQK